MQELTEKRTPNSKTYKLSRHEYAKVFSTGDVHYQDKDGFFHDFDPTLVDGKLTKAAIDVELLPGKIGYKYQDRKLEKVQVELVGSGKNGKPCSVPTPTITKDKVVWEEVVPGVDFELLLSANSVKIDRVIKNAFAETEFEWKILKKQKSKANVRFKGADDDGNEVDIEVKEKSKKTHIKGHKDFDDDFCIEETEQVEQIIHDKFNRQVKKRDSKTRKKTLDTNVKYPVRVDPNIVFTPGTMIKAYDRQHYSGTAWAQISLTSTSVSNPNEYLQYLEPTTSTVSSDWKFKQNIGTPFIVSGIPQNTTISSATARFYIGDLGVGLKSLASTNLKVGLKYESGTLWSPTVNGILADGGWDEQTTTTVTSSATGTWIETDVTALVTSMVNTYDYRTSKVMALMLAKNAYNPTNVNNTVTTAPATTTSKEVGIQTTDVGTNDPQLIIIYSDAVFDTAFASQDSPQVKTGVQRRQDLLFSYVGTGTDTNGMVADVDATILPPEVHGISSSGTNESSSPLVTHVSNISVSADFGREDVKELGRKGPYTKFVSFPVEITTEIEVTSISGDMVSATEAGILTTGGACSDLGNLTNRTIRIATCDGTRIYTGTKNKLSAVNYSGGDAGGGNVSVSYTYTTFNDFTVMHTGDPNTNFASTGVAVRELYLRDL